jgi:hypothetical protein
MTLPQTFPEALRALGEAESDHPLTRAVRGKTVCLAGPAEYLMDKQFGHEIEEADLVARMNTALNYMPFESCTMPKLGWRADIFYFSFADLRKGFQQAPDRFKAVVDSSATRHIVYSTQLNHEATDIVAEGHPLWTRSLRIGEDLDEYFRRQNLPARVHWVPVIGRFLCEQMTSRNHKPVMPRVGFMALCDLLMRGARQVRLYGLTFYHGGGNIFRPDTVEELEPTGRHDGKPSRHDSNIELEMLHELIEREGQRIRMDPITTARLISA